MDHIMQSNTSLIQASDLRCMAVCHDAVRKLQADIQHVNEELDHHSSLMAVPQQLMRFAAALYQALQQVSRLSAAYYFSMHGFITALQEAFVVKGRLLVSFKTGKAAGNIIPEVTNQMVAQLLLNYRPCLIKSHFAVLKLLVSVALLQHNQLCPEAEGMALLRGLQDIEHPASEVTSGCPPPSLSKSTSVVPSWVPGHIHPELVCLDKIPAFNALISSLTANPRQWQEYLHFPSSTVAGTVPCLSYSHLSLLQRALLWKTMIPECLEGLADAMAVCHLCLRQPLELEAPHTGNPQALTRYLVKHKGPVILTTPTSKADKGTSVQPLHLINQLAQSGEDSEEVRHKIFGSKCPCASVHCLILFVCQVEVRVVSFGTLCDTDIILSTLDNAVHAGHWLVFNNCHLLKQWDDDVTAHLTPLISLSRGRWLNDNHHICTICYR